MSEKGMKHQGAATVKPSLQHLHLSYTGSEGIVIKVNQSENIRTCIVFEEGLRKPYSLQCGMFVQFL